ncbi:MAG: hypothetical protein NTX50_13065, partial [Candidatus Sumerlaeota bacterium]|nr:hypothetical protein [Candidatus Sumerlaeota bacterium]
EINMKIFAIKVFIFLSLLLCILSGIYEAFTRIQPLNAMLPIAPEVYIAISRSHKSAPYDTVVLGDSVANQFFIEELEKKYRYYTLTSNAAITLVGQYILVENIIRSNPGKLKRIYLVARTGCISSDQLSTRYAYNYFILPFVNRGNKDFIEKEVKDKLSVSIWYKLGQISIFKLFPNIIQGPDLRQLKKYESSEANSNNLLPSINIIYIKKMLEACHRRNIELHIVSPPLPERDCDRQKMRSLFETSGIDRKIAMEYLNSMKVYAPDDFTDTIHVTQDFLKKNQSRILEEILGTRQE